VIVNPLRLKQCPIPHSSLQTIVMPVKQNPLEKKTSGGMMQNNNLNCRHAPEFNKWTLLLKQTKQFFAKRNWSVDRQNK